MNELEAAQAKHDRLLAGLRDANRYTKCADKMVAAGTEPMHGCWSGGTEYIRAADVDALTEDA